MNVQKGLLLAGCVLGLLAARPVTLQAAAILSCIDSRTTPEVVFDTSVGDLFTARVAANVVTNRRYIAEVSHANAQQSARQIRERSPILREQLDRGEVILVSAVFDVDSGQVVFNPQ